MAVLAEGEAVSEATGTPRMRGAALELAAWRGLEATTVESVDASVAAWSAIGNGRAVGVGAYAKAALLSPDRSQARFSA